MKKFLSLALPFLIIIACAANNEEKTTSSETASIQEAVKQSPASDTAYFAGGCFWCVEASFDQIDGVIEAASGYSGGKEKNPTYKEVSYGKTDHAEAVMVIYNPQVISYDVLLDIFFTAHDPTQLNRQGPDVGKQYRSAIYYTNVQEQQQAQAKIKALVGNYKDPIVTELSAFTFFQMAEDYHQNFEEKNPENSYIVNVSKPKIDKVAEKFKERLKK